MDDNDNRHFWNAREALLGRMMVPFPLHPGRSFRRFKDKIHSVCCVCRKNLRPLQLKILHLLASPRPQRLKYCKKGWQHYKVVKAFSDICNRQQAGIASKYFEFFFCQQWSKSLNNKVKIHFSFNNLFIWNVQNSQTDHSPEALNYASSTRDLKSDKVSKFYLWMTGVRSYMVYKKWKVTFSGRLQLAKFENIWVK